MQDVLILDDASRPVLSTPRRLSGQARALLAAWGLLAAAIAALALLSSGDGRAVAMPIPAASLAIPPAVPAPLPEVALADIVSPPETVERALASIAPDAVSGPAEGPQAAGGPTTPADRSMESRLAGTFRGGLVDPAPRSRARSSGDPYLDAVVEAVVAQWRYPEDADGKDGVARFRIALDRSGRVLSVNVPATSGSQALDLSGIMAIRRADLPPLPATVRGDQVEIDITLPMGTDG